MRELRTLLSTAAIAAVAVGLQTTAAEAVVDPISLVEPTAKYQQSTNNPCVISAVTCPGQTGFDYTNYVHGGVTEFDLNSPEYTAQQIIDQIGGNTSFWVGLDVSQSGPNNPQTLELFEMYVDGVLAAQFDAGGATENVPTTDIGNAGNGFADWLLQEFSLAGVLGSATVEFRAVMSDLNDGPEQFFLISTTATPIPVPAALPLFLTALGGLGFFGWRRRTVAAA